MVIVGGQPGHGALDAALDVFRMRQYFNVVVRARDSLKFLRRKITYGGGTSRLSHFCGWPVIIAIEDSKQIFGAGQARNRTARAVERVIPFQLACQAIAVTWYATAGHHPADAEDHRARAPWYITKARPSTADMAAKLRRVLIAARFQASRPGQPTPNTTDFRCFRLPGVLR